PSQAFLEPLPSLSLQSAALDLRSKEEKDAELDKRIEALRKKNEALIRRYQEIEEDRRKAEQEGVAVTTLRRTRPPHPEFDGRRVPRGVTVVSPPGVSRGTILGVQHKMVILASKVDFLGAKTLYFGGGPPRNGKNAGAKNIEKMNEEMEKIAEYERNQRDGLNEKNPVRNFLDDPRRSGPVSDADRREGSRRHVRNWGGADFDKVKAGMERDKTRQGPHDGIGAPKIRFKLHLWSVLTSQMRSEHPRLVLHLCPKSGASLDMTLSMTGRERAEYVRWKQEREQIDRERLARHRKPGGQWRREWDAEKPDGG
ncbi:hypothetical protein Q9233_017724, partial [Columba guinea]